MHRNTFINSPNLLGSTLELKIKPNIRFAGQITGVEGYVESCLLAGKFAAMEMLEKVQKLPPLETALGSLLYHITERAEKSTFQPMNVSFGLFSPIEEKFTKKDKYTLYSNRPLKGLKQWLLKQLNYRNNMKLLAVQIYLVLTHERICIKSLKLNK